MSYRMGPFLRQLEIEQEIRRKGFDRVSRASDRARKAEEESAAPEAQRVLKGIIDPLAQAIETFVADAKAGKAGRRSTASKYFELLPASTVAYLIAKTILDGMSQNKMEQQVANEVGRAIEDEARLRFYHKENPALFEVIQRDHIRRQVQVKHTKKVIALRLKKAGHEWQTWPESECVHIGMQGIEFMINHTALVERHTKEERKKGKRRTPIYLHLTAEADKLFVDSKKLCSLLSPGFLPCVVKPNPWKGPYRGAYWSVGTESEFEIDKRTCRLVKTSNMDYLEDLRHVEMPQVYEAVNAIQNTAWRINKPVLAVLTEMWDAREQSAKLPSRDDYTIPDPPNVAGPKDKAERRAWLQTDEGKAWKDTPEHAALVAWKKEATKLHEINHKMRSKRMQVAMAIRTAERYADEERIYFPHQLDFRSRVYSMPVCPSPQGPDYSKALLTFAQGQPILTVEAENWLAIHGANSYGIDKVSFHERVDWVRKHERDILAVAEDPMSERGWWCVADSPFQFLAFCFEWAAYRKHGRGFMSSLPVALDGTCNGLQHFSAMLRDERGGRAVNLIKADRPQDIYQMVANHVVEQLQKSDDPLAQLWLEYGIDRKVTKRPVMILPYGGTLYACRKYIKEHLDRTIIEKEKSNVFGPLAPPSVEWDKHVQPAVEFLAQAIWVAIGEVVTSAREAMSWLRKLGRLMANEQLPIVWQTPVGFPVEQAYPEMRNRQVKLVLGGGVIYKRELSEETGRLDKDQQVNGLSPNFVHSLDAAALMACVVECRAKGITSFAMVHDSYGTTAAQTQVLAEALREAFVALYRKHDVLTELRAAVAEALPADIPVPLVPESGSLNIGAVLESKFFFA